MGVGRKACQHAGRQIDGVDVAGVVGVAGNQRIAGFKQQLVAVREKRWPAVGDALIGIRADAGDRAGREIGHKQIRKPIAVIEDEIAGNRDEGDLGAVGRKHRQIAAVVGLRAADTDREARDRARRQILEEHVQAAGIARHEIVGAGIEDELLAIRREDGVVAAPIANPAAERACHQSHSARQIIGSGHGLAPSW
ncbi:hypothetical protein [Rhizobium rhizosphaerae]|uniref:hypothetical protein n=1 Tax=Xaviernesmea rhizosphaerae TaxID=1672749 RepID=UPI001FDAB337|nr:hypothetical protein [Xaviernesmea rhizosphaerae]